MTRTNLQTLLEHDVKEPLVCRWSIKDQLAIVLMVCSWFTTSSPSSGLQLAIVLARQYFFLVCSWSLDLARHNRHQHTAWLVRSFTQRVSTTRIKERIVSITLRPKKKDYCYYA